MSSTPVTYWGHPFIFEGVPLVKYSIFLSTAVLAAAWFMHLDVFRRIHKVKEVAWGCKADCRQEYLQKETITHKLYTHWDNVESQTKNKYIFTLRRRMDTCVLLLIIGLALLMFSMLMVFLLDFIQQFLPNTSSNLKTKSGIIMGLCLTIAMVIWFCVEAKRLMPENAFSFELSAKATSGEGKDYKSEHQSFQPSMFVPAGLVMCAALVLVFASSDEVKEHLSYVRPLAWFFGGMVLVFIAFPLFNRYAVRFNNHFRITYGLKTQQANALIRKLQSPVFTDASTRHDIRQYFLGNAQRDVAGADPWHTDPLRASQYKIIEDAKEEYMYIMHREGKEDELPFLGHPDNLKRKYGADAYDFLAARFTEQRFLDAGTSHPFTIAYQTDRDFYRNNLPRIYVYLLKLTDGNKRTMEIALNDVLLKLNKHTNEDNFKNIKFQLAEKYNDIQNATSQRDEDVQMEDYEKTMDTWIRLMLTCVVEVAKENPSSNSDITKMFNDTMSLIMPIGTDVQQLDNLLANEYGLVPETSTNATVLEALRQVMRDFRHMDESTLRMLTEYQRTMGFLTFFTFLVILWSLYKWVVPKKS